MRAVFAELMGVVNGVPHSCRNDLDEPAVLVGVVVGAHHDGVPLRTA
ncbi:hypothetical protein [Microbispora sp. NPDC049125]